MAKHPGFHLKELVRGFSTRVSTRTPGVKQAPFRQVKLPKAQVISSIQATQKAVEKIMRIEGISGDAAAQRLRDVAKEIKSARAQLGGLLSGMEAAGKTQPITVGTVVRKLTSNRPKTRLPQISTEVARMVATQQTKVLGATIRVFASRQALERQLIGLRR